MGLMDKFLDVMRLNGDDDYDDNYDFVNDDYLDDEDDYEEPKRKSPRRESKSEVKEEPKKSVSKITPITKVQKKPQATPTGMEVCVIKPTTIEDEIEIVDTLLSGKTVLINMEGLNVDIAQRIIDFTSGATYSMQGSLQKVTNYIFLATPNGVDISGDIQDFMNSIESGNNFSFN